MLTAKDLMSSRLMTVSPHMGLRDLVDFLRENGIHAAPVTVPAEDKEKIVGLVSMTDVISYLSDEEGEVEHNFSRLFTLDPDEESYQAFAARLDEATVHDLMTPQVFTCEVDATAGEVASLMTEKGIHRVVVTQDGTAVGLLSATDLLRAVSHYERALAARAAAD
ncbi:MAG: CBS domain-containing protein [Planctomycetota bacterium]|nr:MAG: CBS domain-containing protein [Planctomycetota bacterium]